MAKRTLDFSDYREPDFEEYTGEDPPVGRWFLARATRGKYVEADDQVQIILEIIDGDYAGWGRAVYCDFEGNRKFVFQELVKALQGGKTAAVTIDWENDTAINNWLKKQKPIKIQTREYNDRVTIGKTRANLEAVPSGAKAAAPAPAPAPAQAPADNEEVEPYTEDELQGMDADDLEGILVEEFEVPEDELPAKPRRDPKGEKYKAALIEEILAEQEGEDQEDGDADGAEGDTDGDGPDDGEFDDGFGDGDDNGTEPDADPEPEPAPRARRSRAAKAAPAPEPAPAARTRRTRR